jgi:hypothetical protein
MHLYVGQPPYDSHRQIKLPGGDAGVFGTLWAMKAFVDDAVERSPLLAAVARELGQHCKTKMQRAHAVYEFLKDNVRFAKDPAGLEHVRHPDQLLHEIDRCGHASGDCDDVATLGAAMLKKLGLSPVFIVVGRRRGGRFEHVLYGVRNANGKFFPIDSQHRMIGTLPKKVKRVKSFVV